MAFSAFYISFFCTCLVGFMCSDSRKFGFIRTVSSVALIVLTFLIFYSIQSKIIYNLTILSFRLLTFPIIILYPYSYSSYSISLFNYCFSLKCVIFFADFSKTFKEDVSLHSQPKLRCRGNFEYFLMG